MSITKGQKKTTDTSGGGGAETTPAGERAAALARFNRLVADLIEWGADASIGTINEPGAVEITAAIGNIVYLQSRSGNVSNLFYIAESLAKIPSVWVREMFSPHRSGIEARSFVDDVIDVTAARRLCETSRLVMECIEVSIALSRPIPGFPADVAPVDYIADLRRSA